jgi:capsular polysaccharide biosynthesis protein
MIHLSKHLSEHLSWDYLVANPKYTDGISALAGENNFIINEHMRLIRVAEDSSKRDYQISSEHSDALLSEKTKILIPIDEAYFHFMTETIASMAALAKANKGAMFVFSDKFIKGLHLGDWVGSHLINILDRLSEVYGTSYVFLPKAFYKINNAVLVTKGVSFTKFSNEIYEAFNFSQKSIPVPNKLIYVSRSNIDPEKDKGTRKSGLPSFRIHDEEKVEEFFSSIGFEVVYADKLSITEKVKLFGEAKILAGVTGAGLANIIFMQPGTAIININTEVIEGHNGVRLRWGSHSELYSSIAYYKRLLFISLSPETGNGESVINEVTKYLSLIKEIQKT